jgi:hypothetical protein
MPRKPGAKNKPKYIYVTLKTLNDYFKSQDMVLAISADYEVLFNPKTANNNVTVATHETTPQTIKITRADDDESDEPMEIPFTMTVPE